MKKTNFIKNFIAGIILATTFCSQSFAGKISVTQYGMTRFSKKVVSPDCRVVEGDLEICEGGGIRLAGLQEVITKEYEMVDGIVTENILSKSYEVVNIDPYVNPSSSNFLVREIPYTAKAGADVQIIGEEDDTTSLLQQIVMEQNGITGNTSLIYNQTYQFNPPYNMAPGGTIEAAENPNVPATQTNLATNYYELTANGLVEIDDIVAYRAAKAAQQDLLSDDDIQSDAKPKRTYYTPAEAAAHVNHSNHNKIIFTFK